MRRYRDWFSKDGKDAPPEDRCPHEYNHGYHNAMTFLNNVPHGSANRESAPPKTDHRWPTECLCGAPFRENDSWHLFVQPLYKVTATLSPSQSPDAARLAEVGDVYTLRTAPPGAIWDTPWLKERHIPHPRKGKSLVFAPGSDGLILTCKTPGGDWCIDGRCSNCSMPEDNEHRCWVRHGDVPEIHVDKNGYTCQAGAGSIISGSYHGFLHNGCLVQA